MLLNRIIGIIILFTTFASTAQAATTITSTGISGSGFPVALTTTGETYTLSEDITCATTCFTVKASNITLDLNTHTATFGVANNPGMLNTGMDLWTGSDLDNWTVLDGTVTQSPAVVWGNYDAVLSATASIKSAAVNLKATQTYVYYAMMNGNSSDSYTISIRKVLDDSVLATSTITGAIFGSGFAMNDGKISTAEQEFKPTEDTDVYLQIDCTGTQTKRLHVADIKPRGHYFLTDHASRNTSLYPDLTNDLFGGTWANFTLKNGTITQGSGNAVKSAAIYTGSTGVTYQNLAINMSGNNTTAIDWRWDGSSGTSVFDNVDTDTTSILNFNRMLAPGGFVIAPTWSQTGTVEIKNCSFLNDPEQSIRFYTQFKEGDTFSTWFHHNVVRPFEQVTEGYAVAMSGVTNVIIENNTIDPYRGRGILVDAVANQAGYLDGSNNVVIRNNTIRNIYERATNEYPASGLEAAGIRVRDFGGTDPPEGHRGMKIYDNTISVYVDANGSHRSYGINFRSTSALTDAEIYNNTITATKVSSGGDDWEAACFSLQGVDMSLGGTLSIHNNICTGDVGVRFGGNDGTNVKNVSFYENDLTVNKSILYNASGGPVDSNALYCNKFTNPDTDGFIFYFETGMPTLTNQWMSNNLITNANSSGYEVSLVNNYSTQVISCENGVLDIVGGGQIGAASDPCHNGTLGCYSTAGYAPDITPPSVSPSFIGGKYQAPLLVQLLSEAGATIYYTLDGTTPTESSTQYTAAIPVLQNEAEIVLKYIGKDAAGNISAVQTQVYKCQRCR